MYLRLAQYASTFASETKTKDMKNTDYNLSALCSGISSDAFTALKEMIDDLGLEIEEISSL